MGTVRRKSNLAAVAEDMGGDGRTMCFNHPYKTNLGGGICAFCLQEKLSKLVSSSSSSSSFPFPIINTAAINSPSSSSSSSSPVSFPSDLTSASAPHSKTPFSFFAAGNIPTSMAGAAAERRAGLPFLFAGRRKKKKKQSPVCPAIRGLPEVALKRSKSTAGYQTAAGRHFMDVVGGDEDGCDHSPTNRRSGGGGGFWSFLHRSASSSSSSKSAASRRNDKASGESKVENLTAFEEESPDGNVNGNDGQFPVAFERKVSRSRSVGCESRSFSGDFFERISTGFGDCALRRAESHREGHKGGRNPKIYRCGGIFGGFMMIAAPSPASSSYWVSSSAPSDGHRHNVPGKSTAFANDGGQSRVRSWTWAFASPMRAFSKPGKRRETSIIRNVAGKNSAPNLSAIPSLLPVGG